MTIEQAFERYVGQECWLYTVAVGASALGGYSIINCIVEEIGEGWIRISESNGRKQRLESIVNIANVIRIKEKPYNKKA